VAHTLNPYLSFRGTAREAMEFYASVLGGELVLTTFAEGGVPVGGDEDAWVMHGQLTLGNGMVLMGSDTPSSMPFEGVKGFAVALTGDDADELLGWYRALAATGHEDVPLAEAPWGDWFGQCEDRWGTPWMVNATPSRTTP